MEGGSGSIRWHTAATESHDLCLFPLSVLVSTYYIHAEGVRPQLLVVSTSLLQTIDQVGKKNQQKGNEFITNRYRWLEIYSLDRRKDTELIFLLASWHCRKFVPCPGRKLKIPYWSKKKKKSPHGEGGAVRMWRARGGGGPRVLLLPRLTLSSRPKASSSGKSKVKSRRYQWTGSCRRYLDELSDNPSVINLA